MCEFISCHNCLGCVSDLWNQSDILSVCCTVSEVSASCKNIVLNNLFSLKVSLFFLLSFKITSIVSNKVAVLSVVLKLCDNKETFKTFNLHEKK